MTNMGGCEELESVLLDPRLEHGERMARLRGLSGVDECVRDGLQRALSAQDWDTFELYLLAAYEHPGRALTDVLCEALRLRSRNVPNEDVIQVLAEIADPDSLPCLRETLHWEPEWDEFHQIAVKCVWAVSAIKSPEATSVLVEAAEQGPSAVADWARSKLGQ
nr:hypothetical protein GCM10020241_51400 [Streptoalloteichus tenebrarius]